MAAPAAYERLQMVEPKRTKRVVQHRRSFSMVDGYDLVAVDATGCQQGSEVTDACGSEAVMINVGHAFEGVTEGQVTDIVEERSCASSAVLGGEVRDEGEQAE